MKLKKKKITIIDRSNKIILRRLHNYNMCSSNYINWLKDDTINKFLEVRFNKITKENIQSNIRKCFNSDDNLLMGIYSRFTNRKYEHVGNIKVKINVNHLHGEIGIVIGDTKNFNKKIGSKSINLLSEYLFNSLKLEKLSAGAYEQNIYSVKAFKSAGFKFEAKLKKNRIFMGKRYDEIRVYKLR